MIYTYPKDPDISEERDFPILEMGFRPSILQIFGRETWILRDTPVRFVAICGFRFYVSFPGEAGDPYITPDSMVLVPSWFLRKKSSKLPCESFGERFGARDDVKTIRILKIRGESRDVWSFYLKQVWRKNDIQFDLLIFFLMGWLLQTNHIECFVN